MLTEILVILTPVMVAATTAFGAVMVAKIQKVQKSIKTNHETASLGDATDKILEEVEKISLRQDEILLSIESLRARNDALESRMTTIEKTRSRVLKHVGLAPTDEPPTTVEPKPFWKFWRK